MRDITARFLRSIGVPEGSLDVELIAAKRVAGNVLSMTIRKESPWRAEELELFIEGLGTIDYAYEMSYVYGRRPSQGDLLSLFNDWFFLHERCGAHELLFPGEGGIQIVPMEGEGAEALKMKASRFQDLLRYICYPPEFLEVGLFEKKEQSLEEPDEAPDALGTQEEPFPEPIPEPQDEDWEKARAEEEARERELGKEAGRLYVESIRAENIAETRRRAKKRGNYVSCSSINEALSLQSGNVEIAGRIASMDFKRTRKGGFGGSMLLYDATNGVFCRSFSGKALPEDLLKSLKVEDYILVRGGIELDERMNELQIYVHSIEQLGDYPMRDDPSPVKRVELHLHTRMSAMDGIGDMDAYCRLAAHMGMKAIAVTDHAVIQSFPEAEQAGKKHKLKVLYGCEFNMFDYPRYVFNGTDVPLARGRYCVFDFETTGLSAIYDRPTEFGAVILENGVVVDRFDTFINPEMPIPPFIAEKTRITDEMVKDAPKNDEALEKILAFVGDAVMVSHNATFDIGFLNAMCARAGKPPVKNAVVDTLALSHYLFPNAKGHRLGDLSKNLKLEVYKEDAAHRADFDAEALSSVWQAIISLLLKEDPALTVKGLANLRSDNPNLFKHLRVRHCIALARNREGLRSLYRLISESHVRYLASGSEPKIPRTEIERYRKDLILGSACFNGEVFEAASRGRYEDLVEACRFYDYVEIQPPANYSYRVNIGDFSEGRVVELLQLIAKAAGEAGVPVCATGDCHYPDPEDKVARDVLIASPSVGRGTHPLMRARSRVAYFDNPDQHFRSTEEMVEAFSGIFPPDYVRKIVIDNTNEVADKCEVFPILKDRLYAPTSNFPGSDKELRDICYRNLHEKYGDNPDPLIVERLEKELKGIIDNGYSVTYLIAHYIVKKAHEDGYIVGSRGSVGSSFTATMANITEVNPLPPHYLCPKCKHFEWGEGVRSGFDLPEKKCPVCGETMIHDGQTIPFETFLGFHADKVPDIDLNFPKDYQARAHDYARELLSSKEENEAIAKGLALDSPHVVRAGTISTLEDKKAIGYVRGAYFEDYLKMDPNSETRGFIRALAHRIVGSKLTTGQHPGGIVVIPRDMDIFDFTPFQYPSDDPEKSWLTTHFEFASMHDCLLKLDLLGHVDPLALRSLSLRTGISAESLPLGDPKVLSLFNSPKELGLKTNPLGFLTGSICLPEFGTNFVQRILADVHPHSFDDLLIVSGLSHGTDVWANNIQDLVRDGTATLREVVGCRDDIMTYLISCGVSSLDAFKIMETVRKKDKNLDEKQEAMMREHGVPDWYIASCRKIQYLFPRAHATAYVINAVRNAWYKLYRPLDFYATYFSVRCDRKFDLEAMTSGEEAVLRAYRTLSERAGTPEAKDLDAAYMKSLQAAAELYDRGFRVGKVSITRSLVSDWLVDEKENMLIPPFTALSGLGDAAAETVVRERVKKPFLSQEDLMERTSLTKKHQEELRRCGALDGLNESDQLWLFDF